MGRLGAQRGGTHLLTVRLTICPSSSPVCPSCPAIPLTGRRGGRLSTLVSISEVHRAPIPSWGSAAHLFCWRETVRLKKHLLCPPFPPLVSAQSCLTLQPQGLQRQASLSFTISWSLLRLMSTESVMPSNHLILRRPLLLLPSVLPSYRAFPVSEYFE